MFRMIANLNKRTRKGITLVELVVAMTMTAMVAVVCVALLNPISKMYQGTVKLSRAQLLGDAIIDSIRKECDGIKTDESTTAWIAKLNESDADDGDLIDNGSARKTTNGEGNFLVIQKNNNYAEAIYACLPLSKANYDNVHANPVQGDKAGHAIDRILPEGVYSSSEPNVQKGIVHFGYYQAKEDKRGIFPFRAYDYTNPVLASTYGNFKVKLTFKSLELRDDKYPAFCMCEVVVSENGSKVYSRTAVISFSANGSGVGSGGGSGGHTEPAKDVDVTVKWVDSSGATIAWPTEVPSITVTLKGANPVRTQTVNQGTPRFRFANVKLTGKPSLQLSEVDGYTHTYTGNSDSGYYVIYKVDKLDTVKLISGESFNKLVSEKIANKHITSIVFGQKSEFAAQVTGVTPQNVAIDIKATNDNNRKSEYQLYLVDDGNGGKTAYVLSDDGSFVFNEKCISMFEDCYYVTNITFHGITADSNSKIDTSRTTTMRKMFENCQNIEQFYLPGFVTSTCKDLSYMFEKCFMCSYIDFTNWDTSSVTTMQKMFQNFHGKYSRDGRSFDPGVMSVLDVSQFDFSNVTDMWNMFGWSDPENGRYSEDDPERQPQGRNIKKIKLPSGAKNNTSKVKNMSGMFSRCLSLTEIENISELDFDNVENFKRMFYHCESLTDFQINGTVCNKLTDVSEMFSYCTSLRSINISGWNWPKVTSVQNMFNGCSSLITFTANRFKIPSCTNVSGFFNGCSALENVYLDEWDIRKVSSLKEFFSGRGSLKKVSMNNCVTSVLTTTENMFNQCTNIDELSMKGFIGESCTSIKKMFYGCKKVNAIDISGWDTSKVTDMSYAFYQFHTTISDHKSVDISSFVFDSVSTMERMFSESGVETVVFPAPNEEGVLEFKVLDTMESMFQACKGLKNVTNFEVISIPKVTTKTNVKAVNNIFCDCTSLESIKLKMYVPDSFELRKLFCNCTNLKSADISGSRLPKCTRLSLIFQNCSALESVIMNDVELPLISSYQTSGNGTSGMIFDGCPRLTTIEAKGITIKTLKFLQIKTVESIDISGANVTDISSFESLFTPCTNLKSINMSGINTGNSVSTKSMFQDCANLQTVDFSGWDWGNNSNPIYMFKNCANLEKIYVFPETDLSGRFGSTTMFNGCTEKLTGGAGTVYDPAYYFGDYARVDDPSNGKPGYFSVK